MTYNVFGGTLNPTLLLFLLYGAEITVIRWIQGVKLKDKLSCISCMELRLCCNIIG